jgi:hypothetical protein
MLCHTLAGFEEALASVDPEAVGEALTSTDPKVVFEALLEAPLAQLAPGSTPMLIIIDALDEIPTEGQAALLDVIANQLAPALKPWLRLFVTSREEPLIQQKLSQFKPRELRADEERNRRDVDDYLRTIVATHIQGEVSMADIERDVMRKFGVDMKGAMAELQAPMNESKRLYGDPGEARPEPGAGVERL